MRHSCSENRNRILTATVSVIYCASVLSFTQKWIGGIHMKPILNIENLTNLDQCGNDLFWFSCFPPKIENCDGFPIQTIAWYE